MKTLAGVVFLSLLLSAHSDAAQRNRAVRAEFQRANPCPSTELRRGRCPGYVVDHIVPLCAGGADAASNLQWQDRRESHVKDGQERRLCAAKKRGNPR
jgi:hypothetical protein